MSRNYLRKRLITNIILSFLFPHNISENNQRPNWQCHGRSWSFSRAFWRGRNPQLGEDREHVGSMLKPRWTLQPTPISSQRWYNWQGRTEQGCHLWSSTGFFFPHCTYSPPLYVHQLHSPPSLSHYPPVTAGQFVHPAWLPPPLLLRYLAPLLHFNGRYWLENFHNPFAVSRLRPLPFPATFNLITGFPKLFRGASPRGTIAEQVVL